MTKKSATSIVARVPDLGSCPYPDGGLTPTLIRTLPPALTLPRSGILTLTITRSLILTLTMALMYPDPYLGPQPWP